MNKEIIEQAKNLIAAHSCCQEAKDTANAWLCAVGTADEKEKAKALVAELEEDIMPIDGLIGFAASDMGREGLRRGKGEGSAGACGSHQGCGREVLRLPGLRGVRSDFEA